MAHATRLRRYTGDAELVQQVRDDYRTSRLDARAKAALDYAAKMTRTPSEMARDDIEALRRAGYSDKEIVGITHVAAYFNYMNRIASALGTDLFASQKS